MVATVKCDTITEASNTGTANLSLSSTGNVTIGNNLTVTGTTTQTGSTTFTGPTYFPNGSVSAPSIAHTGDTNCGLYFGTDTIYAATAGTNALTIDSSQNMTVANTLVMGSSFKRNRIINGDMRVDQRNAGASQSIGLGATYTVDRWFANNTNATTGQRVAGTTTQYKYQLNGAASTTYQSFHQRIESVNIADLAGKIVTLSVVLSNSLLTTISWAAQYPTATDNYTSTTTIASGNWTVTSSEAPYTTQITLPANAVNGLEIIFSVGSQTSGNWTIGNVQLEVGSVATPYERQIYSEQLAQCQRYCQKWGGLTSYEMISGSAIATSATQAYPFIQYIVPMRAIPTLTYSTVRLQNVNAGFAITSLTIGGNTGVNALLLTATVASGLTSTAVYYMDTNNSTSAYVILSSEL